MLNQKSELQRALEKHKDNLAKRDLENHVTSKTPELEKVIADRAKRLQDNSIETVVNSIYFKSTIIMIINNK